MSDMLRLFFLVSDVFPDDIAPTQSIGYLKDAIKRRKKLKLDSMVADERNAIFEVKIAPTESVASLQKAIRDEINCNDLPTNQLTLWKVSIPADADLKENVSKLDFTSQEPLSPMATLSKVFPEPPEEEHLHLVVRLLHAGESRNLIFVFV